MGKADRGIKWKLLRLEASRTEVERSGSLWVWEWDAKSQTYPPQTTGASQDNEPTSSIIHSFFIVYKIRRGLYMYKRWA